MKINKVKVDEATNYANLLISGKSFDEVAEECNTTEGNIKSVMHEFLPKNIETFVDYKIYYYDSKPIDYEEIKMCKEVINFFMKHLEKNLYATYEEKFYAENKTKSVQKIRKIKKMLRIYGRALNCLDLKEALNNDVLSELDDFLKEECSTVSNTLKVENRLKTNYTGDENQEKIYELYRKKMNY